MEGDALKSLLERARAWRDADPDAETRDDLARRIRAVEAALVGTSGPAAAGRDEANDPVADLHRCFEPPLGFGTAGLRGLKGPGPAHMNHRLIQRVTAVVADVLRAEVPDAAARGVVIGYDARAGSAELAATAARTIAGAGLGVHTFDDFAPTPLVAFATLELGAAAGIVLTASHNPPEYLGYKLYWANGAQIVPPLDARIAEALGALAAAVSIPQVDAAQAAAGATGPDWCIHGERLRGRYLQAIQRLGDAGGARPAADRRLRIAYSAMHGVAGGLVRAALAAQGGIELHEVADQAAPDGAFPTVNFPNPEEPGALDRLTALAAEVGADVALATDPDGDRLAVALPDRQGNWQVLMGDQTGLLMADHLMARAVADERSTGPGRPGRDRAFVINTVVSSRLLGRVAAHYGVDFEQTLTGFKWIWHRALQREAAGDRFLFGYEDAIGFCPTARVHDKDGIAAAVVVASMARDAIAAGTTLEARLQALYARHGLAIQRQISIDLSASGGLGVIAERVQALRAEPPEQIAGLEVTRVHDYQAAQSHRPDGSAAEPIPLPATDLVQLDLAAVDAAGSGTPAGSYHASIRPSGTEPKLKIYLEYLGRPDSPDPAAETAEAEEGLGRLGESLRATLA